MTTDEAAARYDGDELAAFCHALLAAAGGNEATAAAATRAVMHASRLGVDTHGVRLVPHYAAVIEAGRVNGRAAPSFSRSFGATAVLDADDAHGALAAYIAMDRAVELARAHGIGAVSIRRSSHFGAAGAYALRAAEAGLVGLATCNSDSIVRLHEGARAFHGTNPIAFAAPVRGGDPWLLDMATSAIPFNRVHLFRSLGRALPPAVASDPGGSDTTDPQDAVMLAPLGAAFGFKGAGLAGVAEILSAALSGMALSFELLPMTGEDMSTPRGLGAFVMAIDPRALAGEESFDDSMRRYSESLRNSPATERGRVLAPGDREWAEAAIRRRRGIPLDPDTVAAFESAARRHGLAQPSRLP